MRVCVTGANGYIGSHIVKKLPEYGHKIVDRFDEDLDTLIHCAWSHLYDYNNTMHITDLKEHIDTLLYPLPQNLVVIGTCLEYGLQEGCLSENMPTNPVTQYGLAKDTLRKFLQICQHRREFSLKWIRLFYPIGDGGRSIIANLDRAEQSGAKVFNMSEGNQLRDFINIDTAVDVIIRIAQSDFDGVVNVCSGTPITVGELVEKHIKENDYKIKQNYGYYKLPEYEPKNFWGDTTTMQRILNENKTENRFEKQDRTTMCDTFDNPVHYQC